MSNTTGSKPEEALTHIKAAAAEGIIRFGDDSLTAQLDEEIQTIFEAIRAAKGQPRSKRGLWTADRQQIAWVLEWDENGKVLSEEHEAVCRAGKDLGIELSADDVWEDAALRLRYKLGRQDPQ